MTVIRSRIEVDILSHGTIETIVCKGNPLAHDRGSKHQRGKFTLHTTDKILTQDSEVIDRRALQIQIGLFPEESQLLVDPRQFLQVMIVALRMIFHALFHLPFIINQALDDLDQFLIHQFLILQEPGSFFRDRHIACYRDTMVQRALIEKHLITTVSLERLVL